ncbi:tight adherence protein B [Litoreibacter ponti]|uniref:Tight adherence protein B n=1 Tax=Litoreibacter ponti TaxID=1510457 RepID=A0A2T6BF06_9RHOB|nr:type II secretion system F family protein [Litoreibacter ponti]PTX54645.1 tight adherence protein B [Litoreibacter ponti]
MNQFSALDPVYFVYIGVCIGVLVLAEGIRQSVWSADGDNYRKTKRLKMLSKGMSTEDVLESLRRPITNSRWQKIPIFGSIPAKMQQADFTMKPLPFLLICFGVSVVIFLFGQIKLGVWPALACAVTAGLVIPLNVINIVRRRRVETFSLQLPEALDLMKRGLSVGHPLNVTISNVAKTMKDPIATEFGLVSDQIAYGEDLPEAFNDLARRIDQEDMHYLAASIGIQHGSGGNLGGMFGTLANVIRKRFAMRRRIKAISSEGRISALLLSAMPFLMYGATTVTAPDYYTSVSDDPKFIWMAAAVVILVVSNALVLRKLVTFRF